MARNGQVNASKFFEDLEHRRLMSTSLQNVAQFVAPIWVTGTENADFISVSYSNNPWQGPRVTIRVNPSTSNPGYTVFPNPNQVVLINGLGGNDVIQYSGSIGASIYGGEGHDTITGGNGPDFINGEGGNDVINGGLGADNMSGGAGTDTVDYSSRIGNVRARPDNLANDGETSEGDNVGYDVEVLIGGAGHDYLNFFQTTSAWHRLVGNDGHDTLIGSSGPDQIEDGAGNDSLKGNEGDDVLFASTGNDIVRGDWGRDMITGGRDNDLLDGGDNLDTIWGDEGNDTLVGGDGNDSLRGGADDDVLRGGYGTDTLMGEAGNDRLYGGRDADVLDGGAGVDGLHGGFGGGPGNLVDRLTGGSGSDRFLFESADSVLDQSAEDVRIYFKSGVQVEKTFTGQAGTYTFAAGVWSEQDVERVDTGLHALHVTTGNTRLLRLANRAEMTFVRQGPQIASTGGTFSADAWNDGSAMHFIGASATNVIHEVGHNWDTEFDSAGWNALSGWTLTDMSMNTSYVRSMGTDPWYYLTSADMIRSYARTNPYEDFAAHFEQYMLRRGGLGGSLIGGTKSAFFDNMITTLTARP